MSSDSNPIPKKSPSPRRRSRRSIWTRRIIAILALAVLLWFSRPVGVQIANWRGAAAIEERQHERSLKWLQTSLVLDEDRAETHYLLARCHRRLKHFDKVHEHLTRAFELGYDVKSLELEQTLAHAQTGQYAKMKRKWSELFTNAGSDGPEICEAFVTKSLARLELSAARKVLGAWKFDFPDDPQPYVLGGRLAECLMNWKRAVECYDEALSRSSNHELALIGQARALMKLAKFEEAESALRKVVEMHPTNPDVQILLAQCLIKLNRTTEARQTLEGLLAENPDRSETHALLGQLEMASGNPQKALPALSRAVKFRPSNTEIRNVYGRALKATGRTAESKKEFEFVQQSTKPLIRRAQFMSDWLKSPTDVELRYNIGQITWEYQSREEGKRWLQSNLAIHPNHWKTHLALEKHYDWTGDAKEAAYHKQQASRSAPAP